MRVEVTAEDIVVGQPGHGLRCPVARAIQRARPSVRVWIWRTYVHVDGLRVDLPTPAQQFIDAFDARQPVAAFAFELELPAELEAARA